MNQFLHKIKIDDIDKAILDHLQQDGRIPYSTIAKEVGLTSTAVGQRVQKMVEEGIIEGFGVQLNQEKLGIQIQAMLTLKLYFTKMEAFKKTLDSLPEIQDCYRVTGDDCMIMKVFLRDNKHLLEFLNNLSNYGTTTTNIIIEELR